MSLGAEPGAVIGMVVKGSMGMVLAGAAVGLLSALAVARLIGGFLIGGESYDLATLITVPILLCGVALLAAFVPARRAARVSPVRALRSE